MLDRRLMNEITHKRIYYAGLGGRALALSLLAVTQSFLIALCIDKVFLKKSSLESLTPWLLALALVFVLRPVLMGFHDHLAKKTASAVKRGLRIKLNHYIYREGGHGISSTKTGELSTLAMEGIESVDAYFSEFVPQFILVVVNTVVILGFVCGQDLISAAIMFFTAPLIPVFMILIGKTADGINRKQWDHLKTMNGHLLDVLRGMITLRHFRRHLTQAQSVERTSEGFRRATLRVLRISFLSAFTLELLATLSTAVVAVSLGLRLLYGWMTFLPAMTVLLLAPEFFQPLRQLGQKFHAAMNGKIVADQLYPLLGVEGTTASNDVAPVLLKTPQDTPRTLDASAILNPLPHATDKKAFIEAENLSFGYNKDALILDQLSFTLYAGDSLAVVGRSGIGKTTLIRLLTGSLKNYSGSLKVAGRELKEWDGDQLYQLISYVPQTPRVFRGTVLDNLRFGRIEATLSEVLTMAQATGFDSVIQRLPEGYQTLLGQGAAQLSGGETQLMAITRACIRGTPLILMDEPTSAMDLHMESMLTQAITTLMKDYTLVVAAHRKHTVALCSSSLNLSTYDVSKKGGTSS